VVVVRWGTVVVAVVVVAGTVVRAVVITEAVRGVVGTPGVHRAVIHVVPVHAVGRAA